MEIHKDKASTIKQNVQKQLHWDTTLRCVHPSFDKQPQAKDSNTDYNGWSTGGALLVVQLMFEMSHNHVQEKE